ncbi:SDR family NAD(P)-dependent oxidoreductase [Thermodesulfobacteriota bacterium]
MKKIALITGVARGIGASTAQLFSENGWHVIGVDCSDWNALPDNCRFIKGDVSDTDCWENIVRQVEGSYGYVTAIINNAAIQICKPIVDTTLQEWDSVMAVNLRSVFLSVSYLHPFMKENGGAIVNISSVHAIATSANIAAYATSKGAVSALTRALAIELAPHGIRVNAVLPGAVDTEMLHAGLLRGHLPGSRLEEMMNQLAQKTVLEKIGKAKEISQAILFLADDKKSSFITGQSIVVDGGAIAKLSTE